MSYRTFTVPQPATVNDARWNSVFLPAATKRPSVFAWSLVFNAALILGVAASLAVHFSKQVRIDLAGVEPVHLTAPPLPRKPKVVKREFVERAHSAVIPAVKASTVPSIDWGKSIKPKSHAKKAVGKLQALKGTYETGSGTMPLGGLVATTGEGPAAPPAPPAIPIIDHPSCTGPLKSIVTPIYLQAYMPKSIEVTFDISEIGQVTNVRVEFPGPVPEVLKSMITTQTVEMMLEAKCKPFEFNGNRIKSMGSTEFVFTQDERQKQRTWKGVW